MTVFDFTFNIFSVFPFLTGLINIFLLYLLVTKAHQSLVTKLTSTFILLIIISGLGETLVRSSSTPQAADFWQLFNLSVITTFGPMMLTIALVYTGREKIVSKFLYQLVFFGSTFIFLFLGLATTYFQNKNLGNFHHYYYGWNDTGDSGLFWMCIVLMFLMNSAAIVFLLKYRKKLLDPIKRKQSLLFTIAFFIPIASGVLIDGVIQAIFGPIFPIVSITLFSITAIILCIAILKYKLFIVNPSTVATNILETMNEVLLVFDPNYHIDFVNNAVESTLKYKKNDLVDKSIQTLLSEDWNKFENEIISPIRRGETVSGVELYLKSSDGENIPVAFSASSILDENSKLAGVVGIATDLRKIKSLTASIEQTKNRLEAIKTIINSVISGILVLDINNNVVLVNQSILSILKLRNEDVLFKKIKDIFILREKKVDVPTENIITDGTNIVKRQNLEISAINAQKTSEPPVYVDLISTPISNGKEFGLSSMLVFANKTEEVILEEMKLDFVSMAAHELRTPLTSIRGYVDMLLEGITPEIPGEYKNQLERLSISANNLNSLIENLLNVSRIEGGSLKANFVPLDLSNPVRATIYSSQDQAQVKKQQITFVNHAELLPLVLADEFKISEVIQNLLSNAINYTSEGGQILIELSVKDNYVLFSIKDNGQGIPEAAIPNLFTKFFRVDGKLESGSKGTGLGLYISKSIVTLHKGEIGVESEYGKGSTFYFKLPIASEDQLVKAKEVAGILQPSGSHGIFINENRHILPQ